MNFFRKEDLTNPPPGAPEGGQLEALENAEIAEVSIEHFYDDSYRIWKGN